MNNIRSAATLTLHTLQEGQYCLLLCPSTAPAPTPPPTQALSDSPKAQGLHSLFCSLILPGHPLIPTYTNFMASLTKSP